VREAVDGPSWRRRERHDSRAHLIAPLPSSIIAPPCRDVERDHALGRASQVSDDEADARTKLAWVPLNFRNHPAGFLAAPRLVDEAGVVAAHLMRRSPDRALEQVSDLVLHDAVGRQPVRIAHPFGFQELVNLRVCKGRVEPRLQGRRPDASPGQERPSEAPASCPATAEDHD
jgi:hypothetical protein